MPGSAKSNRMNKRRSFTMRLDKWGCNFLKNSPNAKKNRCASPVTGRNQGFPLYLWPMIFSKFGFGRTSNRRFNYIPRYYDADKEAFNERVNRTKAEVNGESNIQGFENRIRNGFQFRNRAYNNVYNSSGKSTLRIALIALILGAIFYLMFNSGLIDRFFIFFMRWYRVERSNLLIHGF